MIKFNIPGLWFKKRITLNFLTYCRLHPDEMYPNVEIGAVYDSIPYCIWNGGRIFPSYDQATKNDVMYLKDRFNDEFNIPIRLIFTNAQLEPKHLNDRFCNLVLEWLDGPMNEVVIASDILEQHIRQNYPNYKIISSTTKCLTNLQEANEELNSDYYQICLDYNLNHNFEFLNSLNPENKDKVELLINAICPPGCPNRKLHYKLNGLSALTYQNRYEVECQINNGVNTLNSYKNSIQPDEIFNTYQNIGISHFKLEGRTLSDGEIAANYIKYMIKPEYQLKCLAAIF